MIENDLSIKLWGILLEEVEVYFIVWTYKWHDQISRIRSKVRCFQKAIIISDKQVVFFLTGKKQVVFIIWIIKEWVFVFIMK